MWPVRKDSFSFLAPHVRIVACPVINTSCGNSEAARTLICRDHSNLFSSGRRTPAWRSREDPLGRVYAQGLVELTLCSIKNEDKSVSGPAISSSFARICFDRPDGGIGRRARFRSENVKTKSPLFEQISCVRNQKSYKVQRMAIPLRSSKNKG